MLCALRQRVRTAYVPLDPEPPSDESRASASAHGPRSYRRVVRSSFEELKSSFEELLYSSRKKRGVHLSTFCFEPSAACLMSVNPACRQQGSIRFNGIPYFFLVGNGRGQRRTLLKVPSFPIQQLIPRNNAIFSNAPITASWRRSRS